jgi:cytidylate kinase
MRDFSKYHGLPEKDALFFNQSNLIRDLARYEDCIIMGRCADVVLTNNNIPHISIYITAPLEQRIHRVMLINEGLTEKQAKKMVNRIDRNHVHYYKNYTGRVWGKSSNYDLCINSACYGIEGSVDLILRMLNKV